MAYTTFEEVAALFEGLAQPSVAPPSQTTIEALNQSRLGYQDSWLTFLGKSLGAGFTTVEGLTYGAFEGLADAVVNDEDLANFFRENRYLTEQAVQDQLSKMAPADQISMAKSFFPGAGEGDSAFFDLRSLAGQLTNTVPTMAAGIVPAVILGILGAPLWGAVLAGVAAGSLVGGNIWGAVNDQIEGATDKELMESSPMYREYRDRGMSEAEAKDAMGDRVAGLSAGAGAGLSAVTSGLSAKFLTGGLTGKAATNLLKGRVAKEVAERGVARSTVGRLGAGFLAEGAQEAFEESSEYLLQRYPSEQTGIPVPNTESYARGLAEAATGGFLYGGPMGGGVDVLFGRRSGTFLPQRRNKVPDDVDQVLGGQQTGAIPSPYDVNAEVAALQRIGAGQRERFGVIPGGPGDQGAGGPPQPPGAAAAALLTPRPEAEIIEQRRQQMARVAQAPLGVQAEVDRLGRIQQNQAAFAREQRLLAGQGVPTDFPTIQQYQQYRRNVDALTTGRLKPATEEERKRLLLQPEYGVLPGPTGALWFQQQLEAQGPAQPGVLPQPGQVQAANPTDAIVMAATELLGHQGFQQMWTQPIEGTNETVGQAIQRMVGEAESMGDLSRRVHDPRFARALGAIPVVSADGRTVFLGDILNRAEALMSGEGGITTHAGFEAQQIVPTFTGDSAMARAQERPAQPITQAEAAGLQRSGAPAAQLTSNLTRLFRENKNEVLGDRETATALTRLLANVAYMHDRRDGYEIALEEQKLATLSKEGTKQEKVKRGRPTKETTETRDTLMEAENEFSRMVDEIEARGQARNRRFEEASAAVNRARENPTQTNLREAAIAIGRVAGFLQGMQGTGLQNIPERLAKAAASPVRFRRTLFAMAKNAEKVRASWVKRVEQGVAPRGEQKLTAAQEAGLTEDEVAAKRAAEAKELRKRTIAEQKLLPERTVYTQGPGPSRQRVKKGRKVSTAQYEAEQRGEQPAAPAKEPAKKAAKGKAVKEVSKRRTAGQKGARKPVGTSTKVVTPPKVTSEVERALALRAEAKARGEKVPSEAAVRAMPELYLAAEEAKAKKGAAVKAVSKKRTSVKKAEKAPPKKPVKKAATQLQQDVDTLSNADEETRLKVMSLWYAVAIQGSTEHENSLNLAMSEAGIVDTAALKDELLRRYDEANTEAQLQEAEDAQRPAAKANERVRKTAAKGKAGKATAVSARRSSTGRGGTVSRPTGGAVPSGRPGVRVADEQRLPKPTVHVDVGRYRPAGHPAAGLDKIQEAGVNAILTRFVDKAKKAFMLADGAGAGKTRQELVVAAEMAERTGKPSLIITNSKEIIQGFVSEAQALGLALEGHPTDMVIMRGFKELGRVITYDRMKSHPPTADHSVVIFDESHKLKTSTSDRAQASRQLIRDHTVFASATPLDSRMGGLYFLREVMEISEEEAFERLGLRWQTQKGPNDTEIQVPVLKEGVTNDMVNDRLIAMREQVVDEGGFIRRFYPFWGEVKAVDATMPADAQEEQAIIMDHWEGVADSGEMKRSFAMGNRTMETSRLADHYKADEAFQMIMDALAAGRSVVVMSENHSASLKLTGLGENRPSAIAQLQQMLNEAGVEFVKLFGAGSVTKAIDKFQSGAVRVALATSIKGGVGINLDDQTGNAPRTMIVLTKSFAGDTFEQMLGRVSRRETKTPSEVVIVNFTESIADAKRTTILSQKLAALAAIKGGMDMDKASLDAFTMEEEVARDFGVGTRYQSEDAATAAPVVGMSDVKTTTEPYTIKKTGKPAVLLRIDRSRRVADDVWNALAGPKGILRKFGPYNKVLKAYIVPADRVNDMNAEFKKYGIENRVKGRTSRMETEADRLDVFKYEQPVQSVLYNLLKGTVGGKAVSGADLLRAILRTTKNPELRRITSQLLRVAKGRPTLWSVGDDGYAGSERAVHWLSPNVLFNQVIFNPDNSGLAEVVDPSDALVTDVIHEFVHDITSARIETDTTLRNQIWDLMEQAKDDYLLTGDENMYLFHDEHEFVAEIFSDPGHQARLAGIPYKHKYKRKNNMSLLERFVNVVMAALNRMGLFRQRRTQETLLSQFMKLGLHTPTMTDIMVAETMYKATGRTSPRVHALPKLSLKMFGAPHTDTQTRVGRALKWTSDFSRRTGGEIAGRGSKWMAAALPAMTRRQIVQAFERLFESTTGGNPLKWFQRALARKDAKARKYQAESDILFREWEELRVKYGPGDMTSLNETMMKSTMLGVYPSDGNWKADPRNEYLKRVKKDAQGKTVLDAQGNPVKDFTPEVVDAADVVQDAWEKLPHELRQFYNKVLQHYVDENNAVTHLIMESVLGIFDLQHLLPDRTDAAASRQFWDNLRQPDALENPAYDRLGKGGKKLVQRVLSLRNRKGPYFPLRRFGDYAVTANREIKFTKERPLTPDEHVSYLENNPGVKEELTAHTDANGNTYFTGKLTIREVQFFETAAEGEAWRQEVLGYKLLDDVTPAYKSENVSGVQLRQKLMETPDEVPAQLLGAIEAQIAKDDRIKSDSAKEAVRDVLRSAVLQFLPDASIRHAELRRANIPGASPDMQRAFAQYSLGASHYKAQLEEGREIASAFDAASRAARAVARERPDSADAIQAGRVIRELAMRMDRDLVQRQPSQWIQTGTDVGFMWYLFNLSYPMINAMQPTMYTAPYLGAKYGTGKTLAKMTDVYKAIGGKTMRDLAGAAKKMIKLESVSDRFNVLEEFLDSAAEHYGGEDTSRFKRLKAMVMALGDQGIIDISFALDLRGGATRLQEQAATLGRGSEWWSRLKEYGRILPHIVEVQNRLVTSMAAYELHMEKLAADQGISVDELTTAEHDEAVEVAENAVAETQFDYTASNKPRIMNPKNFPAARLMMMFKQHPQHVYALMLKYTYMLKDKESRGEAAKALALLAGSHTIFAGALGAMFEPVKWLIGGTLAMFGDADDEDFDTMFRNTMSDWFGETAGEIISRGAPRALGMDLSGRLSLGNMLFFDTPEAKSESVFGFVGEQVLGPVGGIGVGLFDAVAAARRGDLYRAFEKATPKMVRDVIRTMKLADVGLQDIHGNPILDPDEIGYKDLFWQALGLSSAATAEAYEQRNAALGFQTRVEAQRTRLLERYFRGTLSDQLKMRQEIRDFNSDYPEWKIDGDTLKRSRQMRERRAREKTGAFFTEERYRRRLQEQARFGNLQ